MMPFVIPPSSPQSNNAPNPSLPPLKIRGGEVGLRRGRRSYRGGIEDIIFIQN